MTAAWQGERVAPAAGVAVVTRSARMSDDEWSQRIDQLEAEAQRGLCKVRRLGPFYVVTRS